MLKNKGKCFTSGENIEISFPKERLNHGVSNITRYTLGTSPHHWAARRETQCGGDDGALVPSLVGVEIGTAVGLFPSTNTH